MDAPGLWLERISLPELEDPTRRTDRSVGPGRSAGGRERRSASGDRCLATDFDDGLGRFGSATDLFLGNAEVPLEQDVLPLGVADHPLAVATVLGVVRRQQDQPGHGPPAELLDEGGVPVVRPDLPVGGHRTEVHDPDVTHRGQRLSTLLRQTLGSSVTGVMAVVPPGISSSGPSYPPPGRAPSVTSDLQRVTAPVDAERDVDRRV